jgi:hypothetical protein
MTGTGQDDCCRALSDLVAELTGMANRPAHTDPHILGRVNNAFGRVRDNAPDAYRSDRRLAGFHAETEYFATDGDPLDQLDLFESSGNSGTEG